MAAPNVPQIQAELAKMPDAQLQQYAAMHKTDPYTMSLAMAEFNRRKEMRGAAQAQGGQQAPAPKVADQAVASMGQEGGISQIPTPGVAAMAGGGIVAFANGELVEDADGYLPGEGIFARVGRRASAAIDAIKGSGPRSGSADRKAAAAATVPVAEPNGVPVTSPKVGLAALGTAPDPNWVDLPKYTKKSSDKPAGIAAVAPDESTSVSAGGGQRGGMGNVKAIDPGFKEKTAAELAEEAKKISAGMDEDTKKAWEPQWKLLQDEREELKGRKSQNVNEAMIRAGLGMMAGKSQYALQNIGEGGIQGLESYQKAQQLDDAATKANTNAQMLMTQAERAERSGNRVASTALSNQARQEQQFATTAKLHAEQIAQTANATHWHYAMQNKAETTAHVNAARAQLSAVQSELNKYAGNLALAPEDKARVAQLRQMEQEYQQQLSTLAGMPASKRTAPPPGVSEADAALLKKYGS